MLFMTTGRVEAEWVDYNGHMNVAYYHMAFDRATERFLDRIGLGEDYVKSHRGSMFALEDRLTYRRELRLNEPFRIEMQLLDVDVKMVHYFQRMLHATEGYLAATCEHLSIYVDMSSRRAAPLPEPVRATLDELLSAHRRFPRPPEVGRPMRIRRA